MGKNDPGGLKALANRQKQKGLQKLRWYCQMCAKQCRDENGFKCHLSSESHARQMALFGEAPAAVVDEFSRRFEGAWLDHMRRAHPTTRVRADLVYNELIQHRDHVHMNATRWHTLTEFVSHLGKSGLCKVDEDERGLHVTLAAADSRVAGDEEARARRAKVAAEADARRSAALAAQAERARREEEELALRGGGAASAAAASRVGGELVRKEGDAPVRLNVAVAGGGGVGGGRERNGAATAAVPPPPPIFSSSEAAEAGKTATATAAAAAPSHQRPKSKLELLMEQEQAAKRKREEEEEQQQQEKKAALASAAAKATATATATAAGGDNKKHKASDDGDDDDDSPWLSRGLVVKIMAKELKSSGHYKKKATVVSIVDGEKSKRSDADDDVAVADVVGFVGELETLEGGEDGKGGDVLRVDQAQLETVLPAVGGRVRVVSCSATNKVNRKWRRKREKEGNKGDNDADSDVSRFVGKEGTLAEVDAANYRARVVFSSDDKKEGASFEYEDVCKVVPV